MANKDVRALIRTLKRIPGVGVGGGQHPKVTYNGAFVVSLPSTPSDVRWRENTYAALRRAGVPLEYEGEARPANGQSPPPLPDNIGKEATVAEATVKKNMSIDPKRVKSTKQNCKYVVEAVASHYGLQPRAGRPTPYGFVPRMARIIFAYSEATGREVPHLNYSRNYDNNDMREMARLAANRTSDLYAEGGNISVVTEMLYKQVAFANDAWAWWLAQPLDSDGELITEAEIDGMIDLGTPDEAAEEVRPQTNGNTDLHLRVLAKLIAGGTNEDEAIALAVEIRDSH